MTDDLLASRWRGQPHRLEVWYATVTDGATGTGLWFHHELVAPADGSPAFTHGWIARFPTDGAPSYARYGPDPASRENGVPDRYAISSRGEGLWGLTWGDGGSPLYTFPKWAWEREVLPGAQVVPVPSAPVEGTVELGGERLVLREARGNLARIYGHGNAERWGWLHADLGGGDVLEIVAGVPRRRALSWLPPVPMVQLRVGGQDWPRDPMAAAPMFRARLGLPHWRVRGTVGRRRLRVDVEIPAARAVAMAYADPDGAPATCTNSERADAEIVIERWRRRWETERSWSLRGTAHAEIGTR
ncbi:MAG: hypothetical protein QOG87_2598 [Actinomycetota bacterium]